MPDHPLPLTGIAELGPLPIPGPPRGGPGLGAPPLGDTVFPGPPPGEAGAQAMTLIAEGRPQEARALLAGRTAMADPAPATRLARAIAEDRAGDPDLARIALQALEADYPGWDEPILRRAESLRAAGQNTAAEQAYEAALQANPRRCEALLGLASLLSLRGGAARARLLLARYCGIAPGRAAGWAALGSALMLTGDPAGAEEAFAEASRLEPAEPMHVLNRGLAAHQAGLGEQELARLDGLSEADPFDVIALTARAYMTERLGRRREAIDLLEVAATLAPDMGCAVAALGGLLARASRLEEAEVALRRAADLDPATPTIRIDLGAVLIRRHRYTEARAELERVAAEHPPSTMLLGNLALAKVLLGEQEAAEATAREAVAMAPDAPGSWRALSNTLPYRDGATAAELVSVLRAISDRLPRAPVPAFAQSRLPDRKLRLGLLSGSFRIHPVGWLTLAGFEALSPAEFELICLAQTDPRDHMAQRYRQACAEWHDTEMLDDRALAALARARQVDILIDLGGYGESGRMSACAFRAAPVQIKWVGMQNHSSGLAEMDWIIADRWEIPPALERFYTERPLRLADGYVCYSPPPYAPDVASLPALANGHVTFGCFNNLAKVTPRTIATWSAILRRVPGSRMMVKCQQLGTAEVRDALRARFASHGIAADRLDLRAASPHREFLDHYNKIDIVLDPFPYSGGLTTCEALWMGVPTVTLPGESFAARHSFSHMSNAGLGDWAADDIDGYIDLAVRRANDIDALAALRAGLRAQVKASPLCDAPRFGRSLAAALRHAWRDWCAHD